MGSVIGIDLGITNSVVSYMKLLTPLIVENRGEKIRPSVVYIKENGEVLVGNIAKRKLPDNSERIISEIKRDMGSDKIRLIDGVEYSPEKIASFILTELKEFSQVYIGEKIEEAVITVPANFNNKQREATKKAARLAGLKVKRLISEPTAAALAYGYENIDKINKEKNILVYYLTECTFDVSILELNDSVFDLKSTKGDMYLGGKDFDEKIVDLVLEHIKNENGIDLSNNEQAKSQMKFEAERVNIELSYLEESQYFIPALKGLLDEFGMPICVELKINRNMLEAITSDLIDKIEELIDKSIKNANLDYDDIDIVLTVGSHTKMPIVRNLLKRKFGDKVKFDLNPDEVVAKGAAILGSSDKEIVEKFKNHLEKDNLNINPNNVCPFSLGVEIVVKEGGYLIPGKFDRIINKNTKIPILKKECYRTVKDNQERVLINVFQGEDDFVENNIYIGTVEISGIPKAMAGEQEIEVKFICKEDKTLHIETTLLSTGEIVKSVFLKLDEIN